MEAVAIIRGTKPRKIRKALTKDLSEEERFGLRQDMRNAKAELSRLGRLLEATCSSKVLRQVTHQMKNHLHVLDMNQRLLGDSEVI